MAARSSLLVALVVSLFACGPEASEADPNAPHKSAPKKRSTTSTDAPADPPASPAAAAPPPTFATGGACQGRTGAGGDTTITLSVGGTDRQILVHVPPSYDPTRATMLVTAFHGFGQDAPRMRDQTSFDAEADARGFIMAYAQGTGLLKKGWNGGDCCGEPAWSDQPIDDVAFARAIIAKLSTDYCLDPNRVYNAGFSNGGFMSYRFACEMSEIYTAVASVSGVLGIPPETCAPKRAVPILQIHGTGDEVVPFDGGGTLGGLGSIVGIEFRGVRETLGDFQRLYACAPTSTIVTQLGDTSCEAWSGCMGGASLELCTVDDGGHQWPGGLPSPITTGKTSTFPATKTILAFFDAHPTK